MKKNKFYLIVRLILNYLSILYRYVIVSKTNKCSKQSIFFDLTSVVSQRAHAQLIYFFHLNGNKIYLKHNVKYLANSTEFGKQIVSLPSVFFYRNIDNDAILFTDYNISKYQNKIIKLSDDWFSTEAQSQKKNWLPFSMYPNQYFYDSYKKLNLFRKSKRSIKAMFSGNVNNGYDVENFTEKFKKLNRVEIIKVLEKNLDETEFITVPNSIYDFCNYENKLLLLKWERQSLKQKIEARVEDNDWLSFLSKSDFFLACPGFVHPMCHNIIEAMAVGTIPLLEHPEFFFPPLQHEYNCIVFNGKEDLINKVRLLFSLPDTKIQELRDNVIEYYENYLNPQVVCENLLGLRGTNSTVYFYNSSYFYEKLVVER